MKKLIKRILSFFGMVILTKEDFRIIQKHTTTLQNQLKIMIEEPNSMNGAIISKRHYINKGLIEDAFN